MLLAMIPSGAGGMISYIYITEIVRALFGGQLVDRLGALCALAVLLCVLLAAPFSWLA